MSAAASVPFFACGVPKSGTTFLQRTLNLHPAISCPSEQSFSALKSLVDQMLTHYADILKQVDRRTGGQGASAYGASIRNDMLRAVISTLSRSFARGRPVHGLNDNRVFDDVALFDNLFGGPRIIGIVRNPVDVGLSNWRHNRRLAREEPNHARNHLAQLGGAETVETYLRMIAQDYRRRVDGFLAYASARPNILVVRYELLVASKQAELARILDFLEVSRSDAVIAGMVADSSRKAMAEKSSAPGFFGLESDDPDRGEVSAAFRREMLEAAITPGMKRIGYDVAALMIGH